MIEHRSQVRHLGVRDESMVISSSHSTWEGGRLIAGDLGEVKVLAIASVITLDTTEMQFIHLMRMAVHSPSTLTKIIKLTHGIFFFVFFDNKNDIQTKKEHDTFGTKHKHKKS